ncbi:MAG TPA: response regulator [Rhodocyclaceae bacterium]|nr:response regulator [Rhodocyclaceae bacterium]
MNLRFKLLVPLLLVSAVMSTYLYAFWIPASLQRAEDVQMKLIEHHLESVVEGLIPPILSGQLAMIHDNLAVLQRKNSEWVSVRLIDAAGHQLYPLLTAKEAPNIGGADGRTLSMPVVLANTKLAMLTVVVDIGAFLAGERARHWHLLLLQLGIVFAITLTTGVVLEATVIRPASRLAEASRQLAARNFDAPLPDASDDEIGGLVQSFAAMRHDLQGHHDDLLREIDERKQAQELLRQQQDHLEDLVRMRTAEAEQARDAAQAASRAKSIFLANMSHELRTPLNAVLGFSELMARDAEATPVQRKNLDVINRSGRHLLAMINDVLDLSKIEAGRVELKLEALDLHEMLNDIATMFRVRTDDKGLKFVLDRQASVPRYVRADQGKLRQVLINLLGNSVKFTSEGGLTLHVAAKGQGDDLKLAFEVHDSGCGIPADHLASIFDPFVQTSQQEAEQVGTGLGLTISQQLVRIMGGEITVSSEVGHGSSFRFDIPAAESGAPTIEGNQDKPPVRSLVAGETRRNVLVVDDKEENRLLMRRLLESVGFIVREAENGKECLRVFEKWHPDVIWMDMRMPEMDGYEASRRLRAMPGGDSVKILAVTASAFDEQRGAILAAGCDDVLHKPYRANELFDAMEKHLNVRYEYGKRQERPVEASVAVDFSVLPPSIADSLRQAAEMLDIQAVLALATQIEAQFPEIANRIRTLAHAYEFEALTEALRSSV